MRKTQRVHRAAAVIALALVTALASCGDARADLGDGLFAVLETNKGEIVMQLHFERAPMTTANFVGLAEGTIASTRGESTRYFDGLTFHRVVPGFVVQGGDPSGNGTGGPGYRFPNEIHPELSHDAPGVVAMANSGPHTNGSQFYITLAPAPHLDGGYSVFGRVAAGMDVVQSIEQGDTITQVEIVRNGAAAKAFDAAEPAFRALVDRAETELEADREAAREAALSLMAEQHPDARLEPSGIYLTTDGPADATPAPGQRVTFHYTARVLGGGQFDDTRGRNDPLTLVLGQDSVLPGLDAALRAISPGQNAVAIIPPEMAFGSGGVPGVIPPWSFVVFEIEVLSIE
jgi:cyclophilin family peptidyl-prolyl cis-trans isomerase